MKFRIILLVQTITFLLSSSTAQDNIRDVVILKNNKGIIKGYISEQIPGKTLTIIPSEATLKIEFSELSGGSPFVKKVIKDSTELELDVIRLKDGKTIEGNIQEQSPGNWLKIYTDSMSVIEYNFEDIEIIGKELVNTGCADNILKANGLLDVIYLKNSQRIEGLIIEQKIGSYVKIETLSEKLVYPVQEIVKIGKTGFNKDVDLFSQSSFIDKVETKRGSAIIGIITEQLPGVSIEIKTKESGTFTEKYDDIIKIKKLVNNYRKTKDNDSLDFKPKEPEFIGDAYFIISNDSVVNLEKQQFLVGKKNSNIYIFYQTMENSPVRVTNGDEVTMVIKVANKQVSPVEQIYIFKIAQQKIKKQNLRYIDTEEHIFLNNKAQAATRYVKFNYSSLGESSFKISFKAPSPGEYAIYVEGNPKSFSLFGVDLPNHTNNENNNHRSR